MKRRAIVSALAGALVVALGGCGSGSTKTVVDTVAASTSWSSTLDLSTSTTATTPAGPPTCAAVALQAPRCTLNGVLITVAHGIHTLRLKTLDVKVVGVRTASTVSNAGISSTAKGEFLIITIDVANRADSPETFDDGGFQQQTQLELDGASHTEDFNAENEADAQSFVTNNSALQPGESTTGDLVFDVPPGAAAKATSDSRDVLIIGNFGDDLSQEQPSTLGLITLKGA